MCVFVDDSKESPIPQMNSRKFLTLTPGRVSHDFQKELERYYRCCAHHAPLALVAIMDSAFIRGLAEV